MKMQKKWIMLSDMVVLSINIGTLFKHTPVYFWDIVYRRFLEILRIVCQYPYLRLEPAFYTWYCTKIVKFSLISLCFCQQTLRECEFPEVYDYQDSSNNKMWVFKKCIGYFLSIIFITLSVSKNLEAKQLSPLLDFWKILAIAETYTFCKNPLF